jgi:hypothetical protein
MTVVERDDAIETYNERKTTREVLDKQHADSNAMAKE